MVAEPILPEIAIVAAKRTPIGSFSGQFSHLRAPELAAKVFIDIFHNHNIHALIEEPGIDECILGCVLSAGIGQAPARQALLNAHLPDSIPCSTINKVCGSGMKAVTMGMDSILAGHAKVVLAGGMESMSQAPYLLERKSQLKLGHQKALDHLFYDGLENYFDGLLMGHFAELLVNRDPEKYSREQQDLYAITSVNRAREAKLQGNFEAEVVCLEGICDDEQLKKANLEKISQLKPAFHSSGTITAANASSISDGAAAVLLMEGQLAKQLNLPILAKIKAYSQHALSPDLFTIAPVYAIQKLLQNLDWSVDTVDLFEINEAFAITTMVTIDELKLDIEKVNIHGGACAIGHPIGASGCRVIVSLIHALRTHRRKKGIASVCIGGGEAMAVALEVE